MTSTLGRGANEFSSFVPLKWRPYPMEAQTWLPSILVWQRLVPMATNSIRILAAVLVVLYGCGSGGAQTSEAGTAVQAVVVPDARAMTDASVELDSARDAASEAAVRSTGGSGPGGARGLALMAS